MDCMIFVIVRDGIIGFSFAFFLSVREGNAWWVPLLCVEKIDPKILGLKEKWLAQLYRLAADRKKKVTK